MRLGSTGCVYVTMQAAEDYADARDLQDEEARRELTRHLLDATPASTILYAADDATRLELWRFRRRSAGVDISARVSREDRLAIVVSISVRSHNSGKGRKKS